MTSKDLLIVAKDRGAWIFLLLTPLVVIIVASFALAPAFESGSIDATLLVTDQDEGALSEMLMNALGAQQVDIRPASVAESEALKIGDEEFVVAMVVPPDFSERITSGQPVQLQLYVDPENNIARPYLEGLIDGAATRLSAIEVATIVSTQEVVKAAPGTEVGAVTGSASLSAAERMQDQPVSTEVSNVGNVEELNAFDTQAPGYAVMFMLFGVMTAAEGLLLEKESGTMGRLLVAPISRFSIMGGKLLAQFIVGIIQITLLFTVGHFVFGMSLGNSLTGLALMITVTAYTATAFGILLAGVVKTRRQVSAVGILTILLMSALGGSWWPLEIVPDFMQKLGHLTINAWALDGLNGLILRGESMTDILPIAGVLFAYGCVCFLVGIFMFRFRSAK